MDPHQNVSHRVGSPKKERDKLAKEIEFSKEISRKKKEIKHKKIECPKKMSRKKKEIKQKKDGMSKGKELIPEREREKARDNAPNPNVYPRP